MRIRLPYIKEYRDRHGKLRRYFHRKGYRDIALPGKPGSPEFQEAYNVALALARRELGAGRSRPGSISEAIAAYYQDQSFLKLADSTRGMRRRILEIVRRGIGHEPLKALTKAHIISVYLNRLKPFERDNWLKTLRGLCKFAVAAQLLKSDPTEGIKKSERSTAGSIHTWTEAEVAQFRARHGLGSTPRLALEFLVNLCQRRSDVVRLGPQHIENGMICVRQKKTKMEKQDRMLWIPILPELQAALDATPSGALAFLVTTQGVPFTEKGFGTRFNEWCRQAALPAECSAHGLRKLGLVRLAEEGCTTEELKAISGHRNAAELKPYLEAASQIRLAKSAMERLKQRQAVPTALSNEGVG
jgi:integrase